MQRCNWFIGNHINVSKLAIKNSRLKVTQPAKRNFEHLCSLSTLDILQVVALFRCTCGTKLGTLARKLLHAEFLGRYKVKCFI